MAEPPLEDDAAGGAALDDVTEAEEPSWVTPARVVVLGAALLFLAGVVGYRIGLPERPGAGSAEVGFLQDMIVHHQQAVAMSFATADVAPDAVVRAFAKEIVAAQQYEIGLMDSWLRRWKRPRDGGPTAMGWAGEAHPKESMPGMATDQELDALYAAKGPEVDDRFLRLMMAHHVGGIAMAEAYLERGNDGMILDLARRIVKAQRAEISEMQFARRRLGLDSALVERPSKDDPSSGSGTAPTTQHHSGSVTTRQ